MRINHYGQLFAIARREIGAGEAEDVVQQALLVAVEAGRADLSDTANRRWLCGVVRNQARMALRSTRRRHRREDVWGAACALAQQPVEVASLTEVLAGLPLALRVLATLVLTGHNRREIVYLLDLPDTALRQRISALKRQLRARGLQAPAELSGLNLDLAYGRIREALVPALQRYGGVFASHDPDGHLLIIQRSQN
ncbi:hypothetical protein WH91_19725 [Devosia psychrophila]|uniref:RNA polymerase sigma-70 region 2 domain-containing protein n=1 Tax=Devosia psychrophila TaxID=728005 RepID=A0ABR5DTQ6_9HYPH|nr:sigma factor [Devosia psychrophila]KKC31392.1 hypothetical protein WH91_19725 [Devosia psychrophila]